MSIKDLVILGTSSQQPTRYRSHGAYLIRWNNEGLLFDPGEGTQRQFIFADIAPPTVTRIFISHFHGDHCLGLGSMLMRLNLDKVHHPIHCYFPASGKHFFDRLRYSTAYHETITVIEHPIERPGGVVHDDGLFRIEALFLDHGIDTIGWKISEPDAPRFYEDKLRAAHIFGPLVKELATLGSISIDNQHFTIEDVGYIRKGDAISVIADTRPCPNAITLAHNSRLMISESTYLQEDYPMAVAHKHLTAQEAATIAKEAGAKQLVLVHFSARYPDSAVFAREAQAVFPETIAGNDLQKISFRDNRPSL